MSQPRQLELKDLAPYLPHRVKMIFGKSGRIITLTGLNVDGFGNETLYDGHESFYLKHWGFKLILRPLSDLVKMIPHPITKEQICLSYALEMAKFGNDWYYDQEQCTSISLGRAVEDMKYLYEYHIDVFSLIHQGLAVDINTLEK